MVFASFCLIFLVPFVREKYPDNPRLMMDNDPKHTVRLGKLIHFFMKSQYIGRKFHQIPQISILLKTSGTRQNNT